MLTMNLDQEEYWGKSDQGVKWLTFEDQLDQLFAPVLDLVIDRAALLPGQRVLDIGCGTGISTLAAAECVGPKGHVLGVDISKQFLDRARARAAQNDLSNTTFQYADAQAHYLSPGDRDVAISRFGVMFFEDPVAAFANMARALKPGGHIVFAAWGELSQNPWFKIPHVAAVKRMGQPPKMDRNAPGPLAFHDRDRVAGLMTQAGLSEVSVDAVPLKLTGPDTAIGAAALSARIGPSARTIAHFDGTEEDEIAVRDAVAHEFAPFETSQGTRIPALINILQARRPS
ncbi:MULTISPECIES: class I SAM-dependent methyltransferase [unclassified Ruegeria]|uniref:class I SAM-dependent methyltransferase n=1 Tax=unclassified Ruegeria TaxID=2625375 RepID=UPI00148908CC|nr:MULTISPECIES: class I SAM-dependent methyltransferase [unclassified Ruegeria]